MNRIMHPWAQEPHALARTCASDEVRGLTAAVARTRGGRNTFGEAGGRSAFGLFVRQFASPLILLLLGAVVLTVRLSEYLDAAVIMLAVGTSVALGFYQEYKAERATRALHAYSTLRARVVRDGMEREVDARDVAIGDILFVRAGERVAADVRIMRAQGLMLDESILTGESLPTEKHDATLPEQTPLSERANMMFGGTFVAEGQGRGIVVAVGGDTEFGRIADTLIGQREAATPLQRAVARIGWVVAFVALVSVAIVYVVGLERGMAHADLFLIAVAIAVGAIPEALPPGLTATLAVGVERIARKKGVVRSLLAAETLGSTTVVITDKTGTLTEGRLRVIGAYLTSSLQGAHVSMARSDEVHDVLALAVSNTNVLIDGGEHPRDWVLSGRPFEVSAVRAAAEHGVPVRSIVRTIEPVKLFNAQDKYSVARAYVSLRTSIAGARHGVFEVAVGAPDILLAATNLPESDRIHILNNIDMLSREGKRLVGVAVRGGVHAREHGERAHAAAPLTLLGVIALHDPVRAGMRDTLGEIEATGVHVIMATGDLPGTANAIASTLGWGDTASRTITGDALRGMSDAELVDALSRVRVFARMTPDDKYRIVGALQARGETVAMIGDGVNDAPSLKRADIGVALGSGTDVAKSAADLVLLDDDFRTITAAITEGKLILQNIRKIFTYLMSNAFDEIVLLGGSILLGLALPLTPLQVIWVNFFTGSIPAIAYAFDTEYDRHHKNGEHAILNRDVAVLSFGIGIASSVGLLALYYILAVHTGVDATVGRTVLFACFASYILVAAYSFRNLRKPIVAYPLFSNRVLNVGTFFGIALLAATIYVPFLQGVFDTVALSPVWLLFVAVWVAANTLVIEAVKWALGRSRR